MHRFYEWYYTFFYHKIIIELLWYIKGRLIFLMFYLILLFYLFIFFFLIGNFNRGYFIEKLERMDWDGVCDELLRIIGNKLCRNFDGFYLHVHFSKLILMGNAGLKIIFLSFYLFIYFFLFYFITYYSMDNL